MDVVAQGIATAFQFVTVGNMVAVLGGTNA